MAGALDSFREASPGRMASGSDPVVQRSLSFLQDLLGDYHPRTCTVRLWDGTIWEAEPGQVARCVVAFQHPGALRRVFWQPSEAALGEAYIYDDVDLRGDLEAIFPLGDYLLDRKRSLTSRLRLGAQLLRLPATSRPRVGRGAARLRGSRHSAKRDRQAVTYHYDVSNDFYALWLDSQMVYSCGYFASPDDDLDAAQTRKLDYLCRKLRLRAGERLLDVGCGWGGLILHAAKHYGVRAIGITLSQPQADLANERIQRAGLSDCCRVDVRDYREIDEPAAYDKLASVGMFEHVGLSQLPAYFQQAWRLLRPGGGFLNHGIALPRSLPVRRGPSFSERYVFPDGELAPISATLRVAEASGFEIRDVESLREHYPLTLRHWVRRLEAHHDEARQLTDEATYRTWRLYMVGSAYGFDNDRLAIYQTLLVKPSQGMSGLPLTRDDWYASSPSITTRPIITGG